MSTQASFRFRPDITANKHQGNAESSAAYESGRHSRGLDRAAVLALLRQKPSTPKEIAEALRKPLNAISGRCSELKRDGLIGPTENVRNGSRELRVR